MDTVQDLYHSKAPKWFRTIRWAELAQRVYGWQKHSIAHFYLPVTIIYIGMTPDNLATNIFFKRPRTQEELDALRRKYVFENKGIAMNHERNFTVGQYALDMPPRYDMADRRQAYPEYYAGRYDGFRKSISLI